MKKVLVVMTGIVHPSLPAQMKMKAMLKECRDIQCRYTSDIEIFSSPVFSDMML